MRLSEWTLISQSQKSHSDRLLAELKSHGLDDLCISVNSNAIYVAMPVKLKISIFNSEKNIHELKQYSSQIDAIIQELSKIEMQLKFDNDMEIYNM